MAHNESQAPSAANAPFRSRSNEKGVGGALNPGAAAAKPDVSLKRSNERAQSNMAGEKIEGNETKAERKLPASTSFEKGKKIDISDEAPDVSSYSNQDSYRSESPPSASLDSSVVRLTTSSKASASSSSRAPPILPPTMLGASAIASRRPVMLIQQDILGLLDPALSHQRQQAVMHNPLSGNISAERMVQMMFLQAQIQSMMRDQQFSSTSNNADVAALEYVENRLNIGDQFHTTVKEVKASLDMENVTDADLERPTDAVYSSDDFTKEIARTLCTSRVKEHCAGAAALKKPASLTADRSLATENVIEELTTVMSALDLIGYPTMSEEEVEIDRASISDADKAAALSDLFGEYCSMETHQNKKPRRDLDRRSIDFLVRQMKVEVDLLPVSKKTALLEAQLKCRPEEFSDARLEKFLRTEGMNTKLAAERFVNYWESRRELFGVNKFHLRMTLSEALCDDVTAIEAGMVTILPYPDRSGRRLVFTDQPRNTRQGYTPESLTRAVWYLAEVLAQEKNDPDGSFVQVLWNKYAVLGNYDSFYMKRVMYYSRSCWPFQNRPVHSCCSNLLTRKFGKAILFATMDQAGRARVLIHDVPESELFDILADYGIDKHVLPTLMGGDVDLDTWLPLFIAQRRSIEMEEI